VAASLKQLGERIRDLRKARGWSQERFADISSVHRTYMGHLERGEKNVSFNTLVKLADALGITLPELLAEGAPLKKRASQQGQALLAVELNAIARKLNQRRLTLEETVEALKVASDKLRAHVR
jgi:transcriptional regulator with XRE-family HTH domain